MTDDIELGCVLEMRTLSLPGERFNLRRLIAREWEGAMVSFISYNTKHNGFLKQDQDIGQRCNLFLDELLSQAIQLIERVSARRSGWAVGCIRARRIARFRI